MKRKDLNVKKAEIEMTQGGEAGAGDQQTQNRIAESSAFVNSFVVYYLKEIVSRWKERSFPTGSACSIGSSATADSLRMTMLVAWSVTSLKVEVQGWGARPESGESCQQSLDQGDE